MPMLSFPSPRRAASAVALCLSVALLAGCASPPPAAPSQALQRIGHVVVIFAENHSFDNLYGLFPGADGIAGATAAQKTQLDHDGTPLKELIVFGPDGKPDARFPRLPNAPFRIDAPPVAKRIDEIVPSPIHAFFHNQEQINGGRNNLFAAMSQVGGWTMGYYDGSALQALAMGARVHARRSLLHGRLRRLLPESPVPDLRLRAAPRERAGRDARRARREWQARRSGPARLRPTSAPCRW